MNDLIDINIRPRGIVPLWILISLLILGAKLFGAPIPWLGVAFLPSAGMVLLNLLLLYGLIEATQKDLVYLFKTITGNDEEDFYE